MAYKTLIHPSLTPTTSTRNALKMTLVKIFLSATLIMTTALNLNQNLSQIEPENITKEVFMSTINS